MSVRKSYKDESRKDWGQIVDEIHGSQISMDNVKTGAILRIADAVEIMTKDRVRLENDLKYYRDKCNKQDEIIDTLKRSRNAYKGKLNNLKVGGSK